MAEIDELFGNEKQTTMSPFNKEEWIQQKQENRILAYEMLNTATEELNNPDTLMAYLDIQGKFDRYSVSNALLVAYQCPEATRICDAKTWQKYNAYINKGETAILILEPGKEYERKDGSKSVPYNAKKVFDISQTNSKQRATRNKTPDARFVVKAMIKASPVPVEISNALPEGVNAIYQPETKKIFVRQGMDGDDIFRNLAREIAYARFDKGGFNRNDLEFKAQAVAYIACVRTGFTPEPIKKMDEKFLNLEIKDRRKELSIIRDNANGITNVITKALEAKEKSHGGR